MSDTRVPEQFSLPLDAVNSTAGDNEAPAGCIPCTGEQVRAAHPTTSDHAWPASTLNEIAVTIKDGSHGTHKRVENGVLLLSAKNVTDRGLVQWDESDDRVSLEDYAAICASFAPERDDLLLTIVGTLGRRALFDGARVAFQRSVAFIRPDHRRVRPRYLFHAVASPEYAQQLIRRSNATAQAGLYLGELAKTTVPVPPLAEQSRIAAVLDTADEAIAKTEAVIAKLKQVRAGLLHDLLTHGIDEHGQLRDPIAHPEQFQDSPLGQIPREWEVKTCQSVCREIVVGIVVKPAQYYVEEGVPVLRSANVREEGIQMTDLVFISDESNALLSKSIIRTGNVVTVRTGYPGTSCVVPPHLDGANCVDLIISRPSAEIVPAFLALWINSPFGRGQVLRVQGGLAQQHFNVGELKTLLVAKPDRDEQARIVERIATLDSRISLELETGAKLSLLKSGLMSDLLTGRVRVPELEDGRRCG